MIEIGHEVEHDRGDDLVGARPCLERARDEPVDPRRRPCPARIASVIGDGTRLVAQLGADNAAARAPIRN